MMEIGTSLICTYSSTGAGYTTRLGYAAVTAFIFECAAINGFAAGLNYLSVSVQKFNGVVYSTTLPVQVQSTSIGDGFLPIF